MSETGEQLRAQFAAMKSTLGETEKEKAIKLRQERMKATRQEITTAAVSLVKANFILAQLGDLDADEEESLQAMCNEMYRIGEPLIKREAK